MKVIVSAAFCVLFLIGMTSSCKKFEPTQIILVKTDTISGDIFGWCTVSGKLIYLGEAGASQHGFCWSETRNPTIEKDSINELGTRASTGNFKSTIGELKFNTTYFLRAYATDQGGTYYGNEVSFSTSSPSLPNLITTNASGITENSANSGGNIISDGGDSVIGRGVCWSTAPNPTIDDNTTSDGNGTGLYVSSITGLSCGSTYYVRAYAINTVGVSYGDQVSFSTQDCPEGIPTVITSSVTGITNSSAQCGGTITDEGTSAILARGVCWSKEPNPTIDDAISTDGTGTGLYTSNLTGLICNTNYYVRAYATNSIGTAYGSQVTFSTSACSEDTPTVTSNAVINITETSAESGGEVTSDGGNPVFARGVCWSTSQNPTIGDACTSDGTGTGVFTSSISGLNCSTTYYVRAYATNSAGTAYGTQESFITTQCPITLPTVITAPANNITETSAKSGGEVTLDGGAEVTAKGVCWSTTHNPTLSDDYTTDGTGIGSFISDLMGLSPNTTYYVRAYATNSEGTSYGAEISFLTNTEKIVDYDGNIYLTVQIGDQIWMAENLKVTHYSDGTAIPLVENNALWDALGDLDKAYCWNDNNSATGDTYGGLYTWAAAMNGSDGSVENPGEIQGVCPSGWHLPSDDEWKQLEMYLGMSQEEADNTGWRGSSEGGELKEEGTSHWNSPNTGATNETGFTALPAGNRYNYGTFNNVGNVVLFWTTTDFSGTSSLARSLNYNISKIYRSDYSNSNGFSVRCVKD